MFETLPFFTKSRISCLRFQNHLLAMVKPLKVTSIKYSNKDLRYKCVSLLKINIVRPYFTLSNFSTIFGKSLQRSFTCTIIQNEFLKSKISTINLIETFIEVIIETSHKPYQGRTSNILQSHVVKYHTTGVQLLSLEC